MTPRGFMTARRVLVMPADARPNAAWWSLMIFVLLFAALAAIVPSAADAKAKSKAKPAKRAVPSVFKNMQPMKVELVRLPQANCEPNCTEWIAAEGDIVEGTTAEFRKVLKALGNRKVPVFVTSGGGSIEAAMAIGNLLRERKLDVSVTKTEFVACPAGDKTCGRKAGKLRQGTPNSFNAYCASACTLVLASGMRRVAASSAHVGVHQIVVYQTQIRIRRTYRVTTLEDQNGKTRTRRTLVKEQRTQGKTYEVDADNSTYRPIEKYLAKMGIDRSLIPLMEATPHSSIHWMTVEEMGRTRLVTDLSQGEALFLKDTKSAAAAWASDMARATFPAVHDGKPVDVTLDIGHAREAGKILVRLSLKNGSSEVATEGLFAELDLGGSTVRAYRTDDGQMAVLESSTPASTWCRLKKSWTMRAAIHRSGSGPTGEAVDVPVAGFDRLNGLISYYCPATSTASN